MSDKMKQWRENAHDTYKSLKDIEPDRATKEQFILYACCIALQGHEDTQDETIHSAPEAAAQGENEGMAGILTSYMEDELADAEKYLKLWRDTGDKDFEEIAKQELSHFETLAKYAQSVEPRIDLQAYMVHHNALLAKLS